MRVLAGSTKMEQATCSSEAGKEIKTQPEPEKIVDPRKRPHSFVEPKRESEDEKKQRTLLGLLPDPRLFQNCEEEYKLPAPTLDPAEPDSIALKPGSLDLKGKILTPEEKARAWQRQPKPKRPLTPGPVFQPSSKAASSKHASSG